MLIGMRLVRVLRHLWLTNRVGMIKLSKELIINYHIHKMLADDIIMPIDSHFVSPIVLCREDKGESSDDLEAWWFAKNSRNLIAITQ